VDIQEEIGMAHENLIDPDRNKDQGHLTLKDTGDGLSKNHSVRFISNKQAASSTGPAHVSRSLLESLKHAIDGLVVVFKEERNFRVQLLVTIAVFITGIVLKIDRGEWLVVILLCILVLILEMVNTAIEAIVDMTVGRQFHEYAQKAKDVAAGAVVIAVLAAIINGFIIFLPAILHLFGH
jgi:undecaprenol kinase